MADTEAETAGPGAKPAPSVKRQLWAKAGKQFAVGCLGLILLATVCAGAAKWAVHVFNWLP